MDIVLIGSAPLQNEEQKKGPARVPVPKKRVMQRRRNRQDRRRGVRDGVVVSLSFRPERRRQPDRRRGDDD